MDNLKEFTSMLGTQIIKFRDNLKNIKEVGIKNFLKEQKYILLSISALILLFIISISSMITSKDEFFRDFEIAFKNNKPRIVATDIIFENNKLGVDNLRPLTTYYSNNTYLVDSIIKDLKSNGKSGVFTLKKKKFLFMDSYYADVKPVAVKIQSNFEASNVLLNNTEIKAKGISRGIIPGIYTITGKLNTAYGVVESSKEIVLLQDETVNLNFEAVNISILSNYDDAEVYINNVNTNLTVDSIKDYGPIPTNKGIEVYIQKEFPWGKIKSDSYKVTNVPLMNIPINGITEKVKESLEETMNIFYSSVFDALNNQDYNLIKNCEESIKSKVYDNFNSQTYLLKNNYEISELSTEIQEGELSELESTYNSQVVVKVNYKVYKKLLPFIKTDKELFFIVNLSYNFGSWIVKDLENINY